MIKLYTNLRITLLLPLKFACIRVSLCLCSVYFCLVAGSLALNKSVISCLDELPQDIKFHSPTYFERMLTINCAKNREKTTSNES